MDNISFMAVVELAIYLGETGLDDPPRVEKRWSDEGICDAFR